jgi:hypothetical protein
MESTVIDYMDPAIIRRDGVKALSEALSPVGMAYFFRQIEAGEGNYTEEKNELTKRFTTESIMKNLAAMRNQQT